MYEQVGKPIIKDDLMKKGVIVRILILPGLKEDAKKIIKYLYDTYQAKESANDGKYPYAWQTDTSFPKWINTHEYKTFVRILCKECTSFLILSWEFRI